MSLCGPSNTVAPVVNSLSGPSRAVSPVVHSFSGPSSLVSAVVNSLPVPSTVAPVFNSLPCPNRTVSPFPNSLLGPSKTVAPLVSSSLLLPLFSTASQSPLALLLNVSNNLSGPQRCQAYQAWGLSEQLKIIYQNVFLCLYFVFNLRIICMLKIAYVVEYLSAKI